jgi:hypothetical protein
MMMPHIPESTAFTFFNRAIQQRVLSHGYILYGRDVQAQYNLACYVAQALNCEQPDADAQPCGQCRSCRWMMNNAHPALRTVSRFTYDDEISDRPSKSSTLITVGQIKTLIRHIGRKGAPGEHRVLIFTHCDKQEGNAAQLYPPEHHYPLPYHWLHEEAKTNEILVWKGLTRQSLSTESANAFLKYLEEPTPGLLYFFLTHQPDALLPTIVSRCQSIYVPRNTVESSAPLMSDAQACPPEIRQVLMEWLHTAVQASLQVKPYVAQPLVQAFIEHAETLEVKPRALLQYVPALLREHQAVLFQGNLMGYVRWQKQVQEALFALDRSVIPANALWSMLFHLCEPQMAG